MMPTFKKYTFIISILILCFAGTASAQSVNTFINKTDSFLKAHIKNGRVPYQKIKGNPEKFDELVDIIGDISTDEMSSTQKEAFYINAYNISVIDAILQNGIPSSPQDVKGFFDAMKHTVAGEKLTLNQMEDAKLREVYNDPRLHFSLVCGAKSCPPIRPFAYQPAKLDQQLMQVTKSTLNSNFIRVNQPHKSVEISEIFKWYKQDFLQKYDSALAFINTYRKQHIPTDYSVHYYKYNWSLNSL